MNLRSFGGTSRKTQSDPTLRQVGSHSATPGVNAFKNNANPFDSAHTKTVRDAGTAKLTTSPLRRPAVKGKVDNRNQQVGNSL